MKLLIFLTAFNLLGLQAVKSQSTVNKELQLYITAGMKVLQPKHFGHPDNISPDMVPSIGAGSLWGKRKFQYGFEFSYTDGKKNTPEFGTIFTGINFNVIAGYRWELSNRMKFSLQSGFGYSLYHLSMTDHNYSGSPNLNTSIYHNLIFTIPVSAMLQRISLNGTFVGIRAGYNINAMPVEWRYIEGSTTETYSAGVDGFYFQIVLGGILKLKERNP